MPVTCHEHLVVAGSLQILLTGNVGIGMQHSITYYMELWIANTGGQLHRVCTAFTEGHLASAAHLTIVSGATWEVL